jgi:hypothetical protein
MSRTLPESDWKKFRLLHNSALDRHCQETLSQIKEIIVDPGKDMHERYLAVFRLIQDRDEEVARMFNNMKRSTAYIQLMAIRNENLVTDEEFEQFSQETKESITSWLQRD